MSVWTTRRFKRRKNEDHNLRQLNVEISEKSFHDISALSEVSQMCKGEVIEALVQSHMRRKSSEQAQPNA